MASIYPLADSLSAITGEKPEGRETENGYYITCGDYTVNLSYDPADRYSFDRLQVSLGTPIMNDYDQEIIDLTIVVSEIVKLARAGNFKGVCINSTVFSSLKTVLKSLHFREQNDPYSEEIAPLMGNIPIATEWVIDF